MPTKPPAPGERFTPWVVTGACTRMCGSNPNRMSATLAETVLQLHRRHRPPEEIVDIMRAAGLSISRSAVSNHRQKHLAMEEAPAGTEDLAAEAETPLDTQQILRAIVRRGAATLSLKTTRVTPELLLKAIDLLGTGVDPFAPLAEAMANAMAARAAQEAPAALDGPIEQGYQPAAPAATTSGEDQP